MNTAARLLSQSTVSRTWVVSFLLSKVHVSMLTLVAGVLVSALSIIYVTNTSRALNATIQQGFVERDQLHIQWGQLLLEKSTWIMQARVHHKASTELDMIVPDSQSVVIIHE